jgi:hypothetical protein
MGKSKYNFEMIDDTIEVTQNFLEKLLQLRKETPR